MTTISYDAGVTLADRFRRHAADSTHLYGYAMRGMADDWEAGGPVRQICQSYEDASSGAVIQLRLLAGVFRIVLTGRADQLLPYYPSLGGTAAPAEAWPVLREVIAANVDELHRALEIAPQTNEVGRSAALLAGLLDVLPRVERGSVRLLELGASAGLNLLIDQYAIHGAGWRFGPADSPVQLLDAIHGDVALVPLRIVDRAGCDLHPVDARSASGRLLLTSFVWPFDVHRHQRLADALAVAERAEPVPVDRASASDWLADQLPKHDRPDVLTVIWNSITQQYWTSEEIRRVNDLVEDHGRMAPLARVAMEFRPETPTYEPPELWTTLWPGDGSPGIHRLIGRTHDHGVPVEIFTPSSPD